MQSHVGMLLEEGLHQIGSAPNKPAHYCIYLDEGIGHPSKRGERVGATDHGNEDDVRAHHNPSQRSSIDRVGAVTKPHNGVRQIGALAVEAPEHLAEANVVEVVACSVSRHGMLRAFVQPFFDAAQLPAFWLSSTRVLEQSKACTTSTGWWRLSGRACALRERRRRSLTASRAKKLLIIKR